LISKPKQHRMKGDDISKPLIASGTSAFIRIILGNVSTGSIKLKEK
jgi:hypothetical protein